MICVGCAPGHSAGPHPFDCILAHRTTRSKLTLLPAGQKPRRASPRTAALSRNSPGAQLSPCVVRKLNLLDSSPYKGSTSGSLSTRLARLRHTCITKFDMSAVRASMMPLEHVPRLLPRVPPGMAQHVWGEGLSRAGAPTLRSQTIQRKILN